MLSNTITGNDLMKIRSSKTSTKELQTWQDKARKENAMFKDKYGLFAPIKVENKIQRNKDIIFQIGMELSSR